MEPYYQGNGITIYHGDCMEILHDAVPNEFDLVISDPPYGIEFQSKRRWPRYEIITGDVAGGYPTDAINVILSKAARAAYFFCRWDNIKELPAPKSVLAWIKNNHTMGDLEHEHGRQWEAICFYPRERHQFIKRIPDVVFGNITMNKWHPTEEPVSVISQLIAANTGNVILDPFMGSGTTLIAAALAGRQAIGIDINIECCEVAVERLRQFVLNFHD